MQSTQKYYVRTMSCIREYLHMRIRSAPATNELSCASIYRAATPLPQIQWARTVLLFITLRKGPPAPPIQEN